MKKRNWMWIIGFAFLGAAVASDGKVSTKKLSNGLLVVVKEDHRAPVVLNSVWYRVGGSYEPDGLTGISHMLEHMMFRGSAHYPDATFDHLVGEAGGQENAMTTDDQTIYYEELSNNLLPMAFRLEADRMSQLTLAESAFKNEHQVVMEERRMRVDDSPQGLTWERFTAAAFVNNPYHHPTVGWMTDVSNLTIQDVRQWYKTWYRPNNAILVVVGDVKPEDVFTLAEHHFGLISSDSVPVLKPRLEVPAKGVKTVTVKAPAQVPWVLMGVPVPVLTTPGAQKDVCALMVLAEMLAGSDASWLPQQLVRKQELATEIDVSYEPFSLHPTEWVLAATPVGKVSITNLRMALYKALQDFKHHPIDEKALARVKTDLIAEKTYGKDSLMQEAMEIGTSLSIGLPYQASDAFLQGLREVTTKDIQNVLNQYFKDDQWTVGFLIPSGEKPSAQSSQIPASGWR